MHNLLLSILFISSSKVFALDAIITDQWTYSNTNAQTSLGLIGLATLPLNFIAGYIFWRKVQKRMTMVLGYRADELSEQKEESEIRSIALKSAILKMKEILQVQEDDILIPEAIDKIPEIIDDQDGIILKLDPKKPEGHS